MKRKKKPGHKSDRLKIPGQDWRDATMNAFGLEKMIEQTTDAKSFVQAYGADGAFVPFAYFDKHLDCIRVRIRDCSVIEERLSRIFTIQRTARAEAPITVGFTIKGVRHLFQELELPANGPVKLADIINGIVKLYPDSFVKRIQEEFSDMMTTDVEFDEAA